MVAGAEEIRELVHQWRALMASSRPRWAAADLTFTQLRALSVIAQRQPMRVSDLARSLHMTLAASSALVDRMQRRGLVARSSHPEDRRIVLLGATRHGQRLLDAIERGSSEHLGRLIERMTADERAALTTTLRAFVRIAGERAAGADRRC